MPMFGAGFGKATPWSIDERGAIPVPTLPTSDTSLPAATVAHRPGFFAPNGAGVNILGGLTDGISTALGGQALFAPGQQMRQQRQWQQQDYERKRADDLAQWQAEQQFKIDHPAPVAPHYWETNDGSLGAVGADGRPQIVYKDPTPKVDYTPVKNADGTTTLYPTINGQMVGSGQSAPQPQGYSTLPQGFTVRGKGGAAPTAGSPFPLRPSMQ